MYLTKFSLYTTLWNRILRKGNYNQIFKILGLLFATLELRNLWHSRTGQNSNSLKKTCGLTNILKTHEVPGLVQGSGSLYLSGCRY